MDTATREQEIEERMKREEEEKRLRTEVRRGQEVKGQPDLNLQ